MIKYTDSNGQVSDLKAISPVETITADKTLTIEELNRTYLVGTDALTITLPAVGTDNANTAVAGSWVRFINIGAAGNNIITVSPAAADGIAGTVTLASSVVVLAGTVDKDLINTKATSEAGDTITIHSSGTTGTTAWTTSSDSGIWAAEA